MAEFHRSIKAIRTTYEGRTYRSRTEARWAVFFTLAGVPFQYEREHSPSPWLVGEKSPPRLIASSVTGFEIHPNFVTKMIRPDWPSRRRALWYLPDFYLPEQDLFVEVKPLIYFGGAPVLSEIEKQNGLAVYHGVRVITLFGTPNENKTDSIGQATLVGMLHRKDEVPQQGWSCWGMCAKCGLTFLTCSWVNECPNCKIFCDVRGTPEIQQALRDARLWNFTLEE